MKTKASLIGCSFPFLLACSVYFLTIWLKMEWLIGIRSMLSICLTNLRHIGHLTRRFLNSGMGTYKISWGKECKKCDHSESWFLEYCHESHNLFCREDICLYRGAWWRTNRFLCEIGLGDSRLAWRRRLLDFIVSSFNSKIWYKSDTLTVFEALFKNMHLLLLITNGKDLIIRVSLFEKKLAITNRFLFHQSSVQNNKLLNDWDPAEGLGFIFILRFYLTNLQLKIYIIKRTYAKGRSELRSA